ncbi:MAG: DNA translocase FtsK 4TM domain-containing protein [Actinobacteria bacterium]|nr:DNA translocase FtsK 4TM domain-containing protein [Actinomycetota bacterium]
MGKNSKKTSNKKLSLYNLLGDIYGVALIIFALFLIISTFSSATGIVGSYTDLSLGVSVGFGRYLISLFILIWGITFIIKRPDVDTFTSGLGLAICFLSLIAIIHLNVPTEKNFDLELSKEYGGVIGAGIDYVLRSLTGQAGSYLILSGLLVLGVLIASNISLVDLFSRLWSWVCELREKRKASKAEKKEEKTYEKESKRPVIIDVNGAKKSGEISLKNILPEKGATEEIQEAKTPPKIPSAEDKYILPPLTLLKKGISSSGLSRKSINESIKILEQTLENFDVDAKVSKVIKGPTVTRFEIQLASGVKVNKISSLSDDISLALATPDVRILTPIPGKSAVGIEAPNKQKDAVTLGDILDTDEAKKSASTLTIAIGKDIAGQPVLADLGDMPHLLIAGATGSGKSVCINSILTSLLMRGHPDQLKFILIDPKRIELNLFNNLPHLLIPVIADIKRAPTALGWAVHEMEERFKLLAGVGVRNIDSYNKVLNSKRSKEFDGFEPLSYIVIIIDELADLMMVAASEVEDMICRLAQLARAVGIHLIVATQRPSVDVITGLIKANITSRIAFSVSSQMDSRVILDTAGAEKLIGKGDMLFSGPGASKPRRIQGAMVGEDEIEAVTKFIRNQREADYRKEILENSKSRISHGDFHDDLLDQAMELVILTGQASISMLQRRLHVGYSRAARLVDMLEEKGVIGGHEGSKPRAVLMTMDDFEILKNRED